MFVHSLFLFRLSDPGNTSIYRDVFKLQNRTLTVGQPGRFLDFENFPVFSVLVTSIDSGLPPLSYTGVIRIVLQDVNDQPGIISLSNSQVCVLSSARVFEKNYTQDIMHFNPQNLKVLRRALEIRIQIVSIMKKICFDCTGL